MDSKARIGMDSASCGAGKCRWTWTLALPLLLGVSPACSRLTAPDSGPASGTDEGGGGNGGGPFVGGLGARHSAAGLVSVVPAARRLRVEWRSSELDELEVELALFHAQERDALFLAAPVVVPATSGSLSLEGLEADTRYFVGLGLRLLSSGDMPGSGSAQDFTPAGLVLEVRTGTPIYANPLADPTIADGLTPETAYPNLFLAVLKAFVLGAGQGGNVWVSEGVFEEASLSVLRGVALYGGFGADFELDGRDPLAHVTRLEGLPADPILLLEASSSANVIDGFALDGLGASSAGLDIDKTSVSVRRTTIEGCARGARARSNLITSVVELELLDCRVADNLVEGVSVVGAFDVRIEACCFESNGQEGLDFGPWIAPAGTSVSVIVRDSAFLGNGAEGLDFDLDVPAGATGPGGRFLLTIEDSDFEQNATDGFLIDIDYETTPSWTSEILIRGCSTRANGTHGGALDMDSSASCLVHRLLSTANNGDGFSVTSESQRGLLVLSSSAFCANLGAGVRSTLGNYGIALSHCLLAGNREAGISAEVVAASAASSVAYLQPEPFLGTRTRGSSSLEASPLPFLYAPIEYRQILSQAGAEWRLDQTSGLGSGSICEVAADSVLRSLASVGAETVALEPAPLAPPLPTSLCIFPGTDSVQEDYRLSESSGARAAGMLPPGGAPTDAGLFGWASGGIPGADELIPARLFRVAGTVPAWGAAIANDEDFEVLFEGGLPEASSLLAGLRLVDAAGEELPLAASLAEGRLVLAPPPGGWAPGTLLELHATLVSAVDADPLVPLVLLIGAN